MASFGFPEEELDVPVYFGDAEKRSWIFVNIVVLVLALHGRKGRMDHPRNPLQIDSVIWL